MKKISDIKRKIVRYFCTGICLTSAAFVFQACYGPDTDDYMRDVIIQGKVTSTSMDTPLNSIRVSLKGENARSSYTSTDGSFIIYTPLQDKYDMNFFSPDWKYIPKDTVIISSNKIIELHIRLDAN